MIDEKPQKWIFDELKKSVIDTSSIIGWSQDVQLYLKCDGCGCHESNFEDWIILGEPTQKCTDHVGKPTF